MSFNKKYNQISPPFGELFNKPSFLKSHDLSPERQRKRWTSKEMNTNLLEFQNFLSDFCLTTYNNEIPIKMNPDVLPTYFDIIIKNDESLKTIEKSDKLDSLEDRDDIVVNEFEEESGIYCVIFTPDSKYLILGNEAGSVKKLSLDQNKVVASMQEHNSIVWNITIRNNLMLTSGSDCKLILSDHNKFEVLKIFSNTSFDWTPASTICHLNNDILVSGGGDKFIKVWNVKNDESFVLGEHTNIVRCLSLTSDDKILVSGGRDSKARVWNFSSDKKEKQKPIQSFSLGAWVNCITISSNNQFFITGDGACQVTMFSLETMQYICRLGTQQGYLQNVSIMNNCLFAFSSDMKGYINIWDLTKKKLISTIQRHNDKVPGLALNQEGNLLVSVGYDRKGIIYETKKILKEKLIMDKTEVANPYKIEKEISVNSVPLAFCYTADNLNVAISFESGEIIKYSLDTKEPIEEFQEHNKAVYCLNICPKKKFIVSCGMDNKIIIRDAITLEVIKSESNCHDDGVFAAIFTSENPSKLISCGDLKIKIRNLETLQVDRTITGYHRTLIRCIDISNDADFLASGSRDGTANIYNYTTGEKLFTLNLSGWVNALCFSIDNLNLITGDGSGSIVIWDVLTGRKLKVLNGHRGFAQCVQVSIDEEHIFTSSQDGPLRVFNFDKTEEKYTMNFHETRVQGFRLSSDEASIVSGDYSKKIAFWKLYDTKTKKLYQDFNAIILDYHIFELSGKQKCIIVTGVNMFLINLGNNQIEWTNKIKAQKAIAISSKRLILLIEKINEDQQLVVLQCDDHSVLKNLKIDRTTRILKLFLFSNDTKCFVLYADQLLEVWNFEQIEDDSYNEIQVLANYNLNSQDLTIDSIIYFHEVFKTLICSTGRTELIFLDFKGNTDDGAFEVTLHNMHNNPIKDAEATKKGRINLKKIKKGVILTLSKQYLQEWKCFEVNPDNLRLYEFEYLNITKAKSISISPNGRIAAISSEINKIFLLDLDSGLLVDIYDTKEPILHMIFLEDGHTILGIAEKSEYIFELDSDMDVCISILQEKNSDFLNLFERYQRDPDYLIENYLMTGFSLFHYLAYKGKSLEIEFLINLAVENNIILPFSKDIAGFTPLHYVFLTKAQSLKHHMVTLILGYLSKIKSRYISDTIIDILPQAIAMGSVAVGQFLESRLLDPLPVYRMPTTSFFSVFKDDLNVVVSNTPYINPNDPKYKNLIIRPTKSGDIAYPMSLKTLYLANPQKSKILTSMTASGKHHFFSLVSVKAILLSKWNQYAFARFVKKFIWFGMLMIVFTFYTWVGFGENRTKSALRIFFWVALLINLAYYLVLEITQMIKCGIRFYLKDIWNYIDLLLILILFTEIMVDMTMIDNDDEVIYRVKALASLSAMFFWFRLVSFLRGVRKIGVFIRMIIEMIIAIWRFLLVFLLALVGFAHCMYIMGDHNTVFKNNVKQFIVQISLWYTSVLGDFSTESFYIMEWFFFVFGTFFVVIILLNLLIAIMSSTYEKVIKRSIETSYMEWAGIIVDLDTIWYKEHFGSKYIIVAIPEKIAESDNED